MFQESSKVKELRRFEIGIPNSMSVKRECTQHCTVYSTLQCTYVDYVKLTLE